LDNRILVQGSFDSRLNLLILSIRAGRFPSLRDGTTRGKCQGHECQPGHERYVSDFAFHMFFYYSGGRNIMQSAADRRWGLMLNWSTWTRDRCRAAEGPARLPCKSFVSNPPIPTISPIDAFALCAIFFLLYEREKN